MERGLLESTAPCSCCQAWECRYLLSKARRLQDASATRSAKPKAGKATTAKASRLPPAYLANRARKKMVKEALPEVQVQVGGTQQATHPPTHPQQATQGGKVRRRRRGSAAGEGRQLVREAVVGHVVEGLRGELVRELVGLMDVEFQVQKRKEEGEDEEDEEIDPHYDDGEADDDYHSADHYGDY
jgi:hypothetical protein